MMHWFNFLKIYWLVQTNPSNVVVTVRSLQFRAESLAIQHKLVDHVPYRPGCLPANSTLLNQTSRTVVAVPRVTVQCHASLVSCV